MATREPLEDQSHEAGDGSYANKFIGANENDQQQDSSSDEHGGALGRRKKSEPNLERVERNGQAVSMESNDTATPSTSATSDVEGSANNSPAATPTSHQEQQPLHQPGSQRTTQESSNAASNLTASTTAATTTATTSAPISGASTTKGAPQNNNCSDDEELEEGELKDDDDSDDDIPADNDSNNIRFTSYNNDDNNSSGLAKEIPYNDKRPHDPYPQISSSNFSARGGGGQGPAHPYRNHHRRHMSPNNQLPHHPGMHPQYPPNHHFGNSNDDPYRFQPNPEGGGGPPIPGMPPHMPHHPMAGPPGAYPRGGPGGVGPVQKVNVRCRFYSRTSNKCTWGDHCRFEHRDDSPGPNDVFDDRVPPGMGPGPMRGPPQPPMGGVERPYPPYAGRHQAYPLPPHPYGYGPYEQPPYAPHHSASPPLPPHHSMPPHHWRQQHSPYPSPSSSNPPPESVSPSLNQVGPVVQPIPGGKPSNAGAPVPAVPSSSASPGYSSPSSSAVYERKHRLAYELAPWNDRGYPPPTKYEREPASGYPPGGRGGFYSNHYGRDPYGREPPPPHSGGPPQPYSSPGYPPNNPSVYRGSQSGPHASHYRYMSSSQRAMPSDARTSRSNKRGHDEDESSWSDSGSEDSILGQASSSKKGSANKVSKKHHHRIAQVEAEETSPKELVDQGGSGTPPGEPLPEDRERQEMLLNKLKEIEDLMAKKKGEQDDPM